LHVPQQLPYYVEKDGIKGYERKIVSEIKHMLNCVHMLFFAIDSNQQTRPVLLKAVSMEREVHE